MPNTPTSSEGKKLFNQASKTASPVAANPLYKNSIIKYSEALSSDISQHSQVEVAEFHNHMGLCNMALGHYNDAIHNFDDAIFNNPLEHHYYVSKGDALYDLADHPKLAAKAHKDASVLQSEALKSYTIAITMPQDCWQAYKGKAECLISLKNPNWAIDVENTYKSYIEKHPDAPEGAYMGLGVLHYELSEELDDIPLNKKNALETAIFWYNKQFEVDERLSKPVNPICILHKVQALIDLGAIQGESNLDDASLESYNHALDLFHEAMELTKGVTLEKNRVLLPNHEKVIMLTGGKFNNLAQHCIVGLWKLTKYNVANDKIHENNSR